MLEEGYHKGLEYHSYFTYLNAPWQQNYCTWQHLERNLKLI